MSKPPSPATLASIERCHPDRRVRLHEILRDWLPLGRSWFYELIRQGDIPPGDPIGPRARDWRLGDILDYRARCRATCEARKRGEKLRPGPAPEKANADVALLVARPRVDEGNEAGAASGLRDGGVGSRLQTPENRELRARAVAAAAAKKRRAKPAATSRKTSASAATAQEKS